METELIQQAQRGDSLAIEQILSQTRKLLLAYLARCSGNFQRAEDRAQDVLVRVYQKMAQLSDPKRFLVWVFKMLLAEQDVEVTKPWSSDALEILQNELIENKNNETSLQEIYADYEESYQLKDHVDFCFTVLAKSLLPVEQSVLLLKEIVNLSELEIGEILGKNKADIKELLRDGSETMAEELWQRCSLVHKGAGCTQCVDFGNWLQGEVTTQQQLAALPFEKEADAEESLINRLEIIQEQLTQGFGSQRFHQGLMVILRKALGEEVSVQKG